MRLAARMISACSGSSSRVTLRAEVLRKSMTEVASAEVNRAVIAMCKLMSSQALAS